MGTKDDRIAIAQSFATVSSFIGQRVALLAVQELHYKPYIRDYVKPYLREDLKGVYAGLKREGVYIAPPEQFPLTSVLDVERDYE